MKGGENEEGREERRRRGGKEKEGVDEGKTKEI
jgi:hypothetical protein